MLSYSDPASGIRWKADFFAASLVTPGFRGLPPKIGEFEFVELDQQRFGLPEHPLKSIYPGVVIKHFAMVVPERYQVQSGDKKGVAFWINNNGSGPSVSVTSEMGRSNVAPLDWSGEDARAKPFWEWRCLVDNGQPILWTNARGHGFMGLDGRDAGLDWIDGTPTCLSTMYDRVKGQTAQSVVVPKFYGIGTAGQTIPADALVGTYSIMLFFPRKEMASLAKRLAGISQLLTEEEARMRYSGQRRYEGDRGAYRGVAMSLSTTKGAMGEYLDDSVLESAMGGVAPVAEFEVTHGYEMTQHVIMPPMVAGLWQGAPSVVLVCWPVSEQQAAEFSRPNVPKGRVGFGW